MSAAVVSDTMTLPTTALVPGLYLISIGTYKMLFVKM
jgi:hypothetical protein